MSAGERECWNAGGEGACAAVGPARIHSQHDSRPLRFGPERGFVEAPVQAVLLDESGVGSRLHDPPFVQDHDPVGV